MKEIRIPLSFKSNHLLPSLDSYIIQELENNCKPHPLDRDFFAFAYGENQKQKQPFPVAFVSLELNFSTVTEESFLIGSHPSFRFFLIRRIMGVGISLSFQVSFDDNQRH